MLIPCQFQPAAGLGKWAPVVTENLQAKGFRCQQLAIVCTKIVTVKASPLLPSVIISKASKEQSLFAELPKLIGTSNGATRQKSAEKFRGELERGALWLLLV